MVSAAVELDDRCTVKSVHCTATDEDIRMNEVIIAGLFVIIFKLLDRKK
jgi:hypothetical protein